MYVRDIIPIISYGQFSKPFTAFLEEYGDNRDIRLYLHLLKDKWVLNTDELFEQIDSAIKKCRNSGIKYLLLSDKLDVAKNLTKILKLCVNVTTHVTNRENGMKSQIHQD